jgi:pyruvate dehydrogenase E2 component (dihydrolipoamide acetyltransferase)
VPFEIKMPQLGLTMEKGTVVKWLIAEGDTFSPGDEILEVETDKAIVVVESHQAGTMRQILVSVGEEVAVGAVLAVATAPGEAIPADWTPSPAPSPSEEAKASVIQASPPAEATREAELCASWKARTLAREMGVDLNTLSGSGPVGRIVAANVEAARRTPSPAPSPTADVSPVAGRLAEALGLDPSTIAGTGTDGRILQADVINAAAAIIEGGRGTGPRRPETLTEIPLTGVRGTVSSRMAESARATARVTLFREVNATALIDLRRHFQTQGVSASYNDLLVRVCTSALRAHPAANARLADDRIEYVDSIHIGIAVDTERGLVVPVIRDADTLTIPQIAAASARLIRAARAGRNQPDDLSGGTFTVTNLGMFGVEGFTPVINLPECCILGVGRIARKPVVVDDDDAISVQPMMTISLVFDHRVIDGAPAARFLDRIAESIENPLLML